nr:MAG TPA: tegument protein [Caudoviricetes sp.]
MISIIWTRECHCTCKRYCCIYCPTTYPGAIRGIQSVIDVMRGHCI